MPSGSEAPWGPDRPEFGVVLGQCRFFFDTWHFPKLVPTEENQNLPLHTSFPHFVHAAQNRLLDLGHYGATSPPHLLPTNQLSGFAIGKDKSGSQEKNKALAGLRNQTLNSFFNLKLYYLF